MIILSRSLENTTTQEHQRMLLKWSINHSSPRQIKDSRVSDGEIIYREFVVPKKDSHGHFVYVKEVIDDNYEMRFNGGDVFYPVSIVTLKVSSEEQIPDGSQVVWIGAFKAGLLQKIQETEKKTDKDFKANYLGMREGQTETPKIPQRSWIQGLVGKVIKTIPDEKLKETPEEPIDYLAEHEEFMKILERQPPQIQSLYQKERKADLDDLFALLSVIEDKLWVDLDNQWVILSVRKSFGAKDR